MKNLKLLIIKLVCTTQIVCASVPVEKLVPVDAAFIPAGFDNNDNVELVVTGYLPDLCHKAPSAKVQITGNMIEVKVTSLYYGDTRPFCPEMVVPFTQTVQLGVMDEGQYEVVVNEKTPWAQKEKMKITKSSSVMVDDYNYAYVQYIDKEVGDNKVALRGYNPSDCFVLDKIDFISNRKDTYSILPKMKQVKDFCPMKMMPFSYSWNVPEKLKGKKILLHVRTMDGNSVNTILKKRQLKFN